MQLDHPQTPKEPDNIIESSPSIIFESSWHSEEVPEDWKKGNGIVYSVRPRRGTWGTRGWSISVCETAATANLEEEIQTYEG